MEGECISPGSAAPDKQKNPAGCCVPVGSGGGTRVLNSPMGLISGPVGQFSMCAVPGVCELAVHHGMCSRRMWVELSTLSHVAVSTGRSAPVQAVFMGVWLNSTK